MWIDIHPAIAHIDRPLHLPGFIGRHTLLPAENRFHTPGRQADEFCLRPGRPHSGGDHLAYNGSKVMPSRNSQSLFKFRPTQCTAHPCTTKIRPRDSEASLKGPQETKVTASQRQGWHQVEFAASPGGSSKSVVCSALISRTVGAILDSHQRS